MSGESKWSRCVIRSEKLFVDDAGDTVPPVDPETGAITPVQIFVAVLGASNYTYAEAR
jgi:transposase